MKIAVISDIHSNLEALHSVHEAIQKIKVDQVCCLGDTVGYNANPVECLHKIQEMNALTVAGNHDYAAVGLTDTDYFNPNAKIAAIWSGKQLGQKEKLFIENLPLVRKFDNITLVHATLDHPELWGYIFSKEDAQTSFQHQETPICFIGHSHYPGVFEEGGDLIFSPVGQIHLNKDSRYIVNVGSVGQPRDGNPDSSFVIFDTDEWTLDFHRVPYNIDVTKEKVLAAGLPSFLAERLSLGR